MLAVSRRICVKNNVKLCKGPRHVMRLRYPIPNRFVRLPHGCSWNILAALQLVANQHVWLARTTIGCKLNGTQTIQKTPPVGPHQCLPRGPAESYANIWGADKDAELPLISGSMNLTKRGRSPRLQKPLHGGLGYPPKPEVLNPETVKT